MSETWELITKDNFRFFGTWLVEEDTTYCFCDHAPIASAGTDRDKALEDMRNAAEILVHQYVTYGGLEEAISENILFRVIQ